MGHCCCIPLIRYKKTRRKIIVLMAGLDNSGKSTAVKGLAGECTNGIIPTVGFTSIHLNHRGYSVTIYDVGGGPQIRGIWSNYFGDVHGIIFVIDSSDESRIDESKTELENMLIHEKLAGKPLLLLANKQDVPGALDEIDIVEKLGLEKLVNDQKCPTLVEICSAKPSEGEKQQIDPGLLAGYRWLIGNIIKDYDALNSRVEEDRTNEQEQINREREAWRESKERDAEGVSTNNQENKPSVFFKPIGEVIKSMEENIALSDLNNTKANPDEILSSVKEVPKMDNLNGLNGHAHDLTKTAFTAEIRDQLAHKEKLQRKKMSLFKNNRVSPDKFLCEGLPPVILPGPRGPLSLRQSRVVKALTSPVDRDAPWVLPPLKQPPHLRPLTTRSLGSEGRAWGLNESLEVVLPPETELEQKGAKSDSEDVVIPDRPHV